MMRILLFLLLSASALAQNTWYVRKDGGTRWSSIDTVGQCDGLADASYVSTGALTNASWLPSTHFNVSDIVTDSNGNSGGGFYWTVSVAGTTDSNPLGPVWTGSSVTSGSVTFVKGGAIPVNQHCAFNDYRYLYQDSTFNTVGSFPGWGWVGAAGDTYLIRGSLGTGDTNRVGFEYYSTYCPYFGCRGIAGSQSGSGAPPPPSGTSGAHTKILGENFASCTSTSAKTQLHGGWSLGDIIDLSGASFVDIACLDITDFSACGKSGQTHACIDGTDDYMQVGMFMSNQTHDVTLTDINIHGVALDGMRGPPGGNVVINRINIVGSPSANWDMDNSSLDPTHGTAIAGTGNIVSNFLLYAAGFAEQYPLVWPAANSLGDGTDQSSSGSGDCWGTGTFTSPSVATITWSKGTVAYCTQDGLDGLHVVGPAGTTVEEDQVLAYGSEGQQLKTGGAAGIIRNSVIYGSCTAMAPFAITSVTITSGVITFTYTNFGFSLNTPRTMLISQLTDPTLTFLNGQQFNVTPTGLGVYTASISHADIATTTTSAGLAAPVISGFAPTAFDRLGTICRAANVTVAINVIPGSPSYFQDNTVFSDDSSIVAIDYAQANHGPTNTMLLNNNVFVGFLNYSPGQNPNPIEGVAGDLNMLSNPGASWTRTTLHLTCVAHGFARIRVWENLLLSAHLPNLPI